APDLGWGLVFKVSFGTVSGALGVGAACGTVRGQGWPRRAYRDVFTACPASRRHTQGLPNDQHGRHESPFHQRKKIPARRRVSFLLNSTSVITRQGNP